MSACSIRFCFHPSRTVLLVSMLTSAVAGCRRPGDRARSEPAATTEATEAAEASIRAAAAAFSEAFEAGDTTRLGDLYTEDALLLAPSDTVRGRAAIR